MSNERDELADLTLHLHMTLAPKLLIPEARNLAYALFTAGYRKPRTITTEEELDALPTGSVVLSAGYHHDRDGFQVSFQRWDDGLWHRGARSASTHPDNFLPATVLYEPEPQP